MDSTLNACQESDRHNLYEPKVKRICNLEVLNNIKGTAMKTWSRLSLINIYKYCI